MNRPLWTISIEKQTNIDSDDSEGYSENESGASVPLGKTPRSHHCLTRTGTPAFIPHNINHRQKLVAIATRLKMIPPQQVAYTGTLIAEAGGDSWKVSSSYSVSPISSVCCRKEHCDSIQSSMASPQAAHVILGTQS